MKTLLFSFFSIFSTSIFAQTDSAFKVPVIVHKDFRLNILAKKEAELNSALTKAAARSAMGFRLQVLSTNDREHAMKIRTQLLQRYPEHKPYMSFQAPYVKLTFGNFVTRKEAEFYKTQISRMLGGASVYILSQRIEIKPEKEKPEDSQ